jgi:restriction endonuclease Mrr
MNMVYPCSSVTSIAVSNFNSLDKFYYFRNIFLFSTNKGSNSMTSQRRQYLKAAGALEVMTLFSSWQNALAKQSTVNLMSKNAVSKIHVTYAQTCMTRFFQ